jgi:ABC-type branched-subunit amino acid transport system ATPase component/predicted MFS family arabinose efflux permease
MRVETEAPERPRGLRALVERIAPELKGMYLIPLLMLFLLNFVDEFDRGAFVTLAPEIQDAFGLSDAAYGGIVALSTGLVWLAAPVVGFLADRYNRIRISVLAAAFWGLMAFSTGLVTTVFMLALVRFGSGASKTVNEPVHTSLLADYYPPEARGRVFSLHRIANPIGGIFGPPLAGLIAFFFFWEAAFFLLAIPTFILLFFAIRLREPMRGETDDPEAAAEAAKEPPVPFSRAVRWLYSVPTLKRIYIGSFFGGTGWITFVSFASIFYEREFGLNELQRGLLGGYSNVFVLAGILVGGALTDRLRMKAGFKKIALGFGGSVFLLGLGLAVVSAATVLPLVLIAVAFASFFGGSWLPAYLTVIGFSSPARIRSLGFSYAALFFALGTLAIPIGGGVSDVHGVRWALFLGASVLALGGMILASSARFVDKDVTRALRVLATEAELRRERLDAGRSSLLAVRDLDVAYDEVQVLFGVNFDVKEGDLVALLGTNGAGKSTLLKAVSGLVHPRSGAVFFDGKDITHFEPEETARAGIVQMPGGKAVFPSLSVKENLEMAGWSYRSDEAYVRSATASVLEVFPVLAERLNQPAGTLSGGEQQMLSLAQAFIAKPRLMMIDELSLGLAPVIVTQLLDIVKEINRRGVTIVLVEQSVNVALTLAQHAYFMEKGEIRFSGPTEELLERRDILRAVFLEGAAAVKTDGKDRGG